MRTNLRTWFSTDGSLKLNLRFFFCVFAINFVVVMSLAFALYELRWNFFLAFGLIGKPLQRNPVRLFFLVGLVGPFLEEYIFRYPALIAYRSNKQRFKYAFVAALLVSSLIFALVHSLGEFKFPLPQFITGAALFWVGSRTSIFYCIAFHMLNNLAALLLTFIL